jgi:aspartate/methionine/tyrosine aminotransferase
MRSSVMRDLMSITARPEVISLAGGLPDTGAFDPHSLRELTHDMAMEHAAAALQYGPTEGLPMMRETICRVMASEQMVATPDQVIVTTGGQQVLDLVARAFIDPGDVVIAEGPTYPGAVPVFNACQADVRQIPIDAEGLDGPAARVECVPQSVSLRLTPVGGLFRDADGTLSPYATGHGDMSFAIRASGALDRATDILTKHKAGNGFSCDLELYEVQYS